MEQKKKMELEIAREMLQQTLNRLELDVSQLTELLIQKQKLTKNLIKEIDKKIGYYNTK